MHPLQLNLCLDDEEDDCLPSIIDKALQAAELSKSDNYPEEINLMALDHNESLGLHQMALNYFKESFIHTERLFRNKGWEQERLIIRRVQRVMKKVAETRL